MKTWPPPSSVVSVESVASMWNMGVQAMKASPGTSNWSSAAMQARAIVARWLISAPLGRPVVPLV